MTLSDDAIKAEILRQISGGASTAPRDVAQVLCAEGDDWRKLLPRIKQQALKLYDEQQLLFVRKRKPVIPSNLKGVYRLAGRALPETI